MELTTYSCNVLGVDLEYRGPRNVEDISNLCGDPMACQKAFMKIYAYQDRGPALRKALAEKLEADTQVARERTPDLDEAGNQKVTKNGDLKWAKVETEDNYISRLVTEKVITQDEVNAILRQLNEELGDYSFTPVRSAKPGKQFYELASKVLAKIAAGKVTQERAIAALEAQLGTPFEAAVGAFNEDNLARYMELIHKKALEALSSNLDNEADEE